MSDPGLGAVNTQIAEQVVGRLRDDLTGREHHGAGVASVFHYGAVDIDPRHLVVWILLAGRPDEQIPAWQHVSPQLLRHLRPTHIDYDWLLSLREVIGAAFRVARWPDPDGPTVMVDSEHRVESQGGWNYFR
jgi:hypothetical protein